MAADLHLVIPNNNKRALLRQTLRALDLEFDHRVAITVIDNASTDGSASMVAGEFPAVKLIERVEPNGSSANFNLGILAGDASRFIGILHEDAYPTPGALDALIRFLDEHPRAGAVSPRIRFPDGSLDSTPRRFPTIVTESVGKLKPLARVLGSPLYDEMSIEPFRVDYCSATCLIFRRSALEQVGLFDRSFVIFYEEVDLYRRLADHGWESWFFPLVEVIHEGGVTRQRGPVSAEVETRYRSIGVHFRRSRYLYFRKHRGLTAELLLRLLDIAIAAPRLMGRLLARLRPGRDHRGDDVQVSRHLNAMRVAVFSWPRLRPGSQDRLAPPE